MLKRNLYVKICALMFSGLGAFAIASGLLWNYAGNDQFDRDLFQKTTALAEMLLPAADAPISEQVAVVTKVAADLDFDVTLYSPSGELIAATAEPATLPKEALHPGNWQGSKGLKQWTTILDDGRRLVINLDRLYETQEALNITILLGMPAILIAILLFPLVRGLTRRLEKLKEGVEKIGSGYLGARVDVDGTDEIGVLAKSFNQAAEEIETLVAAQRLLLAHASHELRTPLARIRLGTEMFMADPCAVNRKALDRDIGELDSLIDELILMTRLDSKLETGRICEVDLLAIAAEECARYPTCSLDGETALMHADANILHRLLRNLIDNAYKHGEEPISVEVQTNPENIRLAVTDSGPGIGEDEVAKVLEPFYRGSDRQNVKGSGLGLAIVKKIALSYNAEIDITSSPSSQISILFPHTSSGLAS
ncbi:ATP-binding protein [Labrenzia sp. CE80]|uniref:sensor histidine kinase n=1 Tax=Labrenzia sp. CE80 TaxID=1788986 RepID=UPI00129ABDBE|nr:ATP-binding protein [Labrenzia sp. CE80]